MKRNARTAEARPPSGGFRGRLHEVIFEADTRAGRAFENFLGKAGPGGRSYASDRRGVERLTY